MPSKTELKHEIVEFVDQWEPRFSLAALCTLGAAYLLGHIGSERGEVTQRAAEIIEKACTVAAACVAVLQGWNWLLRFRKPHTYEDPKRPLPTRDSVAPGFVLMSGELVGYPKYRFFVPTQEELETFVEWSAGDSTIAGANDLKEYQRKLLYESWYAANPKQFLILQVMSTFGTVWRTVAISIILDLPMKAIESLRSRRKAVIDIHTQDLAFEAEDRPGRFLLYDTLIFDVDFRKTRSEFKRWHSLFHLAQFPAPAPGSDVSVFIEPDNLLLNFSIKRRRYGRYRKTKLISKHTLFEFSLPRAADQSKRARNIVFFWRLLRSKHYEIPIGCQ